MQRTWALIARRGVLKGGTKEKILNLVHEEPGTLAQLSQSLEVSQPTIHRHLTGLVSGGLIATADNAKAKAPAPSVLAPTQSYRG